MKNTLLCLSLFIFSLSSCNTRSSSQTEDVLYTLSAPVQEITIFLKEKGAEVAPSMYGIFFEEINHAGDGGLYAELVKNRSFQELEMPEGYHAEGNRLIPKETKNHVNGRTHTGTYKWTTEAVPGWKLNTEDPEIANMELTKENPNFPTAPNNLKVNIRNTSEPVQLINEGYWGMNIVEKEKYQLRIIVRPEENYNGDITVKLISPGNDILASTIIHPSVTNDWNDIQTTIEASGSHPKAKLLLEFTNTGTIRIDYVSLFPEKTFNNRANGLREDIANMLVDLKPAFVRWPGGCVVEGITLENRFEWKKTLGDPAARPGEYSTWGYRCSYGFGYYELLQFCEDIQADAMYVCNVGLGCQARAGDACDNHEINYYLQDCLDAIEYALGDPKTKWGAKRAEDGHPEPFPLKYVEIGNENWGAEYDKRFDIFYKTIKKKYPELILISNHGLNGIGNATKTDMVDPHWYVAPDYFFENSTIFDEHPRGNYTVYVGEYACNSNVGGGNMAAALSEAAFIAGMERNGDLVTMTSYAPLLENRNDREWPVNLIWFDTDQVVGRSSYYVQKMAADHKPTYNVKSSLLMTAPKPLHLDEGYVGVGAWNTEVEFKDFRIQKDDSILYLNGSDFSAEKGEWIVEEEILKQTSRMQGSQRILNGFAGNNYTLEFKARKTAGEEGCFIYFGMIENGYRGYIFNVGGWGNTATGVERIYNGTTSGRATHRTPHTVETDKWYDVKVIANPSEVALYMDNTLILTFDNLRETPRQFFSSGYNETTGEIILKVVNASAAIYPVNFTLDGATNIENKGKVVSLSSKSGYDENSFINPQKIYPQESEYNEFGKEFKYNFAPFSYTILRIKADQEI